MNNCNTFIKHFLSKNKIFPSENDNEKHRYKEVRHDYHFGTIERKIILKNQLRKTLFRFQSIIKTQKTINEHK